MSRLPETTAAEFNAAVAAAKGAFPAWRATPVPTRTRWALKFQELIRTNWVRRLWQEFQLQPEPGAAAGASSCCVGGGKGAVGGS